MTTIDMPCTRSHLEGEALEELKTLRERVKQQRFELARLNDEAVRRESTLTVYLGAARKLIQTLDECDTFGEDSHPNLSTWRDLFGMRNWSAPMASVSADRGESTPDRGESTANGLDKIFGLAPELPEPCEACGEASCECEPKQGGSPDKQGGSGPCDELTAEAEKNGEYCLPCVHGPCAKHGTPARQRPSDARNPNIPRECRSCGRALLLENLFVDDGCPCNSPRGVNFAPAACGPCGVDHCVKPGHRLASLFGEPCAASVVTAAKAHSAEQATDTHGVTSASPSASSTNARAESAADEQRSECECPVEGHALGCEKDNGPLARLQRTKEPLRDLMPVPPVPNDINSRLAAAAPIDTQTGRRTNEAPLKLDLPPDWNGHHEPDDRGPEPVEARARVVEIVPGGRRWFQVLDANGEEVARCVAWESAAFLAESLNDWDLTKPRTDSPLVDLEKAAREVLLLIQTKGHVENHGHRKPGMWACDTCRAVNDLEAALRQRPEPAKACEVCDEEPAAVCKTCQKQHIEEAIDHYVDDKGGLHCRGCIAWGAKCAGMPRSETPEVWADEASPFTGSQVKALLDENEILRKVATAAGAVINTRMRKDDEVMMERHNLRVAIAHWRAAQTGSTGDAE